MLAILLKGLNFSKNVQINPVTTKTLEGVDSCGKTIYNQLPTTEFETFASY